MDLSGYSLVLKFHRSSIHPCGAEAAIHLQALPLESCICGISIWDLCHASPSIRQLVNSGMLRTFESYYNCEGALQKWRGRCCNGLRKGLPPFESKRRSLARTASSLGGVTRCIPQLVIAASALALVSIPPIKPRCSCLSVNLASSLRGDRYVMVVL